VTRRQTRRRAARPAVPSSATEHASSIDTQFNVSAAIVLGCVALVTYLLTLHRGVPGGDSGEMIAAAATTGVAHPSGYPLMLVLAKIAALVPIGSIATRINAFSAVCDAAAAALLVIAAARLSRSTVAGLLAGGLFAFSSRIWSYATVAEVFALNNLIVAALVATLAAATPTPSRRHVAVASLLAGLGVANHLTSLFISVPIVGWLLWSARAAGVATRPLFLTATAAGLAGLVPYVYLPLASAGHSLVSWGDQTTVTGFVRHVLRSEYGVFKLGPRTLGTVASGVEHALAYLRDLPAQVLWVGVPLALVGMRSGLRTRPIRGAVATLLAALVVYVVVFNALSNLSLDTPLLVEIQSRFWQMPNAIVCVFVALGAAATAAALPRVPRAVLPAFALVAVTLQAGLNYRTMDESRNRWVDTYGRAILDAAPKGALILSRGDVATNAIRYLRYGEHVRPDEDVIDQESLSLPWGPPRYARLLPNVRFPAAVYDPRRSDAFSIKQFIDANIDTFPIVVCGGFKEGDESVTPADYRMVPMGVCAHVERASTPFAVEDWLARSRPLLPAVAALANDRPRQGSFEELVLADDWNAWHARAHFVMKCEDCGLAEDDRLLRFATMAEEMMRLGPPPPVPVYKNLAYALVKVYPTHPEVRDRLVTALQEYLKVAPPDDRDLPAVRDNLAKLGGPKRN